MRGIATNLLASISTPRQGKSGGVFDLAENPLLHEPIGI